MVQSTAFLVFKSDMLNYLPYYMQIYKQKQFPACGRNLFSLYLLVYQGSGSLVYSIMFDFHTILNLIYEIIVRVYYALVCLYRVLVMYVHQCMTTNKCLAFASYEGKVKTSHYRDGHDMYVLFQYMFCTFTVKIACIWNHSLISY